jgi:hypothetical protein
MQAQHREAQRVTANKKDQKTLIDKAKIAIRISAHTNGQ